MKVDNTGAMAISALGSLPGYLRTDGAGNISINNITTAANQIAKYSDAVGTTAASGSYLNANNNLSIGTTAVPTGATSVITLFQGAPATAIAAGLVSIGNRSTGTGDVLAIFGGGNGGVSASVSPNTMTNKISIYINGTRYYLLASTNAT